MKMSAQLRMIAKGRFANGDAVAADRLARAAEDYDRLEQENAELREFKEKALKCLDYTLNWAPASWQAQTVEDLLESQKQSEEKAKQLLKKLGIER